MKLSSYNILYVAFATSLVVAAPAEPASSQIGIETHELGSRVLVFVPSDPGLGNSAAILGDDFVVVVDAPSPTLAAAALDEIRRRTASPVRYLVNTHWHDDHVWGNQVYARAFPQIEIIAHAATRDGVIGQAIPALAGNLERLTATVAQRDLVLESGVEDGAAIDEDRRAALAARQAAFRQMIADMESIEPTPPRVLIRGSLTLHDDSGPIVIAHMGRGNTTGDLVVWDSAGPCGDHRRPPDCPIPAGGEVPLAEWDATLDAVAELNPAFLVPGHGQVMHDLGYLNSVRGLIGAVRSTMAELVADGASRDEAIERLAVPEHRAQFTRGDKRHELGFDRFFLPTPQPPPTTRSWRRGASYWMYPSARSRASSSGVRSAASASSIRAARARSCQASSSSAMLATTSGLSAARST